MVVTEEGRTVVYNLYEIYEKKKQQLGDSDAIDQAVAFLRKIDENDASRMKIQKILDEVYVDEVQDLRMLEIILLLRLFRNPRGIHFAGDTAQSISKDSSFRFGDLKRLFFEHFDSAMAAQGEPELARPKMFKLAKNYRSHQGIISLAAFVMSLLYRFFPDTVDKLPAEKAEVSGPKPIIFGEL